MTWYIHLRLQLLHSVPLYRTHYHHTRTKTPTLPKQLMHINSQNHINCNTSHSIPANTGLQTDTGTRILWEEQPEDNNQKSIFGNQMNELPVNRIKTDHFRLTFLVVKPLCALNNLNQMASPDFNVKSSRLATVGYPSPSYYS